VQILVDVTKGHDLHRRQHPSRLPGEPEAIVAGDRMVAKLLVRLSAEVDGRIAYF